MPNYIEAEEVGDFLDDCADATASLADQAEEGGSASIALAARDATDALKVLAHAWSRRYDETIPVRTV